MKQAIIGAIVGALILVAGIISGQNLRPAASTQVLGGSLDVAPYSTIGVAGTSTVKTITTSSTQLVATSTGISYMVISNGGAPIYCQADNGKAAVVNSGIGIASSTQYEISLGRQNLYRGTVNCITAAGSSIVSVYAH